MFYQRWYDWWKYWFVLKDEDESSDDEDDTAELMAELQKIKKERANEKARLVN